MTEKVKDYDRGTRIADRRKELGLTQDELAHRIGIGRQALSAIENGGAFKAQTLERLVSALDVSERYIMRGEIEDSKAELIAEAVDVLSEMTESQIQQFIAMMKATKNVTASIQLSCLHDITVVSTRSAFGGVWATI